jgi:uncharacterized protein (TIGR02453 family)
MITAETLKFLYELSQNNNRDWFEKNKPRYEKHVKKAWEQAVDSVIAEIRRFEPDIQVSARDCIMRIYRDTRFSQNKSPYKTNLAAIISRHGRKNMEYPGYYLHLEYGNLMLGGGAYFLEKEPLHRVRRAIMRQSEQFMTLVEAPEFVTHFGSIQGEKNKVLPPEFKEAATKIPLLANKQFYYMAEMDPELSIGDQLPTLAARHYHAALGVNQFLRQALYTTQDI